MNEITSSQPASRRPRPEMGVSGQVGQARRSNVEQAIAGAANRSDIDFDYLMAQAQVESSLNPRAKARTSSATGLYQFIDSTWLATVKKHGPRFGLEGLSAKIGTGRGGAAYVADPAQREAILALRNDPQVASYMAAELAEDNRASLLPVLGREPDHSELYLAHFLGAGGASRFLSSLQSNPDQSAAALFPKPAAVNRPVFYDSAGGARSLSGVMDYVRGRMDGALEAVPSLGSGEAVPRPINLPAITYMNRPSPRGISPPHPEPAAPTAMSQVLKSTFGTAASGSSDQAGSQVKRAYDRLRAFGL